jgi:hypothetical protein
MAGRKTNDGGVGSLLRLLVIAALVLSLLLMWLGQDEVAAWSVISTVSIWLAWQVFRWLAPAPKAVDISHRRDRIKRVK